MAEKTKPQAARAPTKAAPKKAPKKVAQRTTSSPASAVQETSASATNIQEPILTGNHEMAYPTAVNDQITDAVTQSNVSVLAEAPAMAMGTIYQSLAHSLSLMYQNAVTAQQQLNVTAQAATTMEAAATISK